MSAYSILAAGVFILSGAFAVAVIVHDIWADRYKIIAALAYQPIPKGRADA